MCENEVSTHDGVSGRRVDILAIDPSTPSKAYIIDPTVRYETNSDIGSLVQEEKEAIYNLCFHDLRTRYHCHNFETIDLWFGSRGAISTNVLDFFTRFALDKKTPANHFR